MWRSVVNHTMGDSYRKFYTARKPITAWKRGVTRASEPDPLQSKAPKDRENPCHRSIGLLYHGCVLCTGCVSKLPTVWFMSSVVRFGLKSFCTLFSAFFLCRTPTPTCDACYLCPPGFVQSQSPVFAGFHQQLLASNISVAPDPNRVEQLLAAMSVNLRRRAHLFLAGIYHGCSSHPREAAAAAAAVAVASAAAAA